MNNEQYIIHRRRGLGELSIWWLGGLFLLLTASCGSLRKSADNFYVNYSKKLGVPFTGKENKKLIAAVDGWMGVPYKYGGSSKKGVDCSALVGAFYKEAFGIALPRTTSDMAKKLTVVRRSSLQCGDVVFFTIKEKKVSHTGMYLADNKFVHASSSRGVRISSLDEAYWQKYYAGAGRLSNIPAQKSVPAPKSDKSKTQVKQPPPKTKKKTPAAQQGKGQKIADDVIIVFDDNF
jgi:hypothetical protein